MITFEQPKVKNVQTPRPWLEQIPEEERSSSNYPYIRFILNSGKKYTVLVENLFVTDKEPKSTTINDRTGEVEDNSSMKEVSTTFNCLTMETLSKVMNVDMWNIHRIEIAGYTVQRIYSRVIVPAITPTGGPEYEVVFATPM